MKTPRLIPILLASAFLVFSGCAALEGDRGEAGVPGLPGPPGGTPAQFSVTINTVTVPADGQPVVEFTAYADGDNPYAFLSDGDATFNIAQLVAATGGNSSRWQNYINDSEVAGAGAWGAGGTATQAELESDGTLVNNLDGTYSYTFATDISAVTTPTAVTYSADLTHRVGFQSGRGSGLPFANATYDFLPSSGDTTGIPTRNIVDTASCNECHNKLALHGGARLDTKLCVTCHNPGSADANSGNTVDFKVMIHKIHRGKHLPSVEAGGEYAIWGFGNSKHDYSKVGLPMDIKNCTKCHDAADDATPDGGNWATTPTAETCGACHDTVNFTTGVGHTGGIQADNSGCAECHVGGVNDIATKHQIPAQVAAANFEHVIDKVTFASNVITVDFYVKNPTTDARYDIRGTGGDPNYTSSTGSLDVLIGWDSRDYNNEDSGNGPGQPLRINAKTTATLASGTCPTDCLFRVTQDLSTLPNAGAGALASWSGVVAVVGHPAALGSDGTTYNLRVPVKSALQYFAIRDSTPQPRRQAVDITSKCDKCHQTLTMHGSSRTDEGQVCVICHNPSATDIAQRPDAAFYEGGGTAQTLDGKRERPIDFKRMIHGIHGAGKREKPYVVYGFGKSAHSFDLLNATDNGVHFPGILNDCTTCHVSEAYELPIYPYAQGTTVNSVPAVLNPGSAVTAKAHADFARSADNLRITPTAGVCSACHDTGLAQAHMEQNGGNFAVIKDNIGLSTANNEACAVCHGPGRAADLEVVHHIP